MKYLSVCSGIEAATVAWHSLGWNPIAFSDIEPFPSAVLAHHYPHVPNLGDMTKFEEWNLEPIDLLVGGTPCQSFSVAGLRKGLADPRGNLMLTFLAIAQRHRPRWIVWENVPGVLSSNGGRDFGTFLGALGELGYGWAYRVLDAQWFGVAQRRRRVFVVGHLGDWQRAAAVLFERESVRRDTPPSREARQGAAVGAAQCFAGSRQSDVAATLETTAHDYSRADGFNMVAQPIAFHNRQDPDVSGDITHPLGAKDNGMAVAQLVPDVAPTLDQRAGRSGENSFATSGGLVPVAQPVAFRDTADCLTAAYGTKWNGNASADNGSLFAAQPIPFRKSRRAQSVDDHETWVEDGIANTLNCHDVGDIRAVDVVAQPIAIHPHVVGRAPTAGPQGKEYIDDGSAYCMDARGVPQAVAQPVAFTTEQTPKFNDDCALTLTKQSPTGGGQPQCVSVAMQVRRLTPVECERLQGFSDNYTNIPWRKKPESPDGPRYKALGNSMAVPVMRWIGERIAAVDNDPLA